MTQVVSPNHHHQVLVVQSSNASSIHRQNPTKNRNHVLYQHNNITSSLHTHHQQAVEEEIEEVLVEGGERKRIRRHHQQHQHQEEEEVGEQRREVFYHSVNSNNQEEEELSNSNFVGLFLTAFRRSVLRCSSSESSCGEGRRIMEIGVPTNVRHVAHVTFDRFNGFLGLPVEFEPEVPRRPPSASATVFGVSTNSMQLSFDTRGNSVPTILLMMQHRLYSLGGLQSEGIFRINPDNGREEYLRDQLNRGLVPDDVDVHSLAGLIKAWFRELPTGILDCLSPEEVMQSQTEQEYTELARLLPPTEAALLDWAINLMADVAQFEYLNKMNARNIAMVFAPNMTHMADPLTALMHAVQVMNFLKTLIEKTLKDREDSVLDSALDSYGRDPSGENGHYSSLQTIFEEANSDPDGEEERYSRTANPSDADYSHLDLDDSQIENIVPEENQSSASDSKHNNESTQVTGTLVSKTKESKISVAKPASGKPPLYKSSKSGQTSTIRKVPLKNSEKTVVQVAKSAEKTKGSSLVSSMNLRTERIEAWR